MKTINNHQIPTTPMPFIVAAFLFHQDKVLLIKHRKSGKWLPVGGHVEEGESLHQALEREIREETGLTGCQFPLPPKTFEEDDDKKREPLPFHVQTKDGETIIEYAGTTPTKDVKPQESEITDHQFLTLEELEASADIPPIVKEKAKLAKEFLKT